ncbi:hypothetical protein WU86_08570, partial [Corynebacterium xerosis]
WRLPPRPRSGRTIRAGRRPRAGGGYYANCSAARAAGVAPIPAGAPGYRAGLDRDNDGWACE